jgi:hypothetical protein
MPSYAILKELSPGVFTVFALVQSSRKPPGIVVEVGNADFRELKHMVYCDSCWMTKDEFSRKKSTTLKYVMLSTETSATCNSRCAACPSGSTGRRGFIDAEVEDRVVQLIRENPDIRFNVCMNWTGEPLLYQGLEKYISRLCLPNVNLWVCTNGVLLTEERFSRLYESGLRNVWFSMFYVDESEYNRYTRTNNFQAAWEHLIMLAGKSDKLKKIKIVTFSQDLGSIEEFIKKPNIEVERARPIQKWEIPPVPQRCWLSITISGEISLYWQDYRCDLSIGNIKTSNFNRILEEYFSKPSCESPF